MRNTLWYFPLESLKERYTEQLSCHWMPTAFKSVIAKEHLDVQVVPLMPNKWHLPGEIKVGSVLDATGRGMYSLGQCTTMLENIRQGKVNSGDVLYFQDFWTPGMEAIFYALHLY
jgi:hypothetical protein